MTAMETATTATSIALRRKSRLLNATVTLGIQNSNVFPFIEADRMIIIAKCQKMHN